MADNNTSWGAPTPNEPKPQGTNSAPVPEMNAWGAVRSNYNEWYSKILKAGVFGAAFIAPLIVWLAIAIIFAEMTNGISFAIAIVGYPITAFICWVIFSYFAKLFDNITKMTQNTEAILNKLQEIKEDKNVL